MFQKWSEFKKWKITEISNNLINPHTPINKTSVWYYRGYVDAVNEYVLEEDFHSIYGPTSISQTIKKLYPQIPKEDIMNYYEGWKTGNLHYGHGIAKTGTESNPQPSSTHPSWTSYDYTPSSGMLKLPPEIMKKLPPVTRLMSGGPDLEPNMPNNSMN